MTKRIQLEFFINTEVYNHIVISDDDPQIKYLWRNIYGYVWEGKLYITYVIPESLSLERMKEWVQQDRHVLKY